MEDPWQSLSPMRLAFEFNLAEMATALATTLPMVVAPLAISSVADADVVITDRLESASELLNEGKYVVHLCLEEGDTLDHQHPPSLTRHPRFRVVRFENGAGMAVLVLVVCDIGKTAGTAGLIEVV